MVLLQLSNYLFEDSVIITNWPILSQLVKSKKQSTQLQQVCDDERKQFKQLSAKISNLSPTLIIVDYTHNDRI